MGFGKENILPVYFPLRELIFSNDSPLPLHENLAAWSRDRFLDISSEQFLSWLQTRKALVLLDGLDEVIDLKKRRQVCDWIRDAWAGLENARFVLTSRPAGYRKMDGLALDLEHFRADIMDFSNKQQEYFLHKWFQAVFLQELTKEANKKEIELARKSASKRAETIIDYLSREENKGVREIARIPMLLQIMAVIWKDREFLPGNRSELLDVSLDYLLDYRDRRRKIVPLLPAEKVRMVLAPTALWMLETLESDNAKKEDIHRFMQPLLDTMINQPDAHSFCENLRDRSGLTADYGRDNYIFRFRFYQEYLAGMQLIREVSEKPGRMDDIINYFNNDWWEEVLRFFISKSDGVIFDNFIANFFDSDHSKNLNANKQNLLLTLVREAPQKRLDAFKECLSNENLGPNQIRYVLDCLRTIGTPGVVDLLIEYLEKEDIADANLDYINDLVSGFNPASDAKIKYKIGLIHLKRG